MLKVIFPQPTGCLHEHLNNMQAYLTREAYPHAATLAEVGWESEPDGLLFATFYLTCVN